MKDHLPKGWTTVRISELCDITKQKGCEGIRPYLEIGNVDIISKNYVFTQKPSVKGCRTARRNDLLVSKVRPTRGAITFVREDELQVSSAFTILRNRGALAEKYLWLYLAWNRDYLNHLGERCTGTMYPTTSDNDVVEFDVPIPPLPGQRRIVERLEMLLRKVDTIRSRLERIPTILKRFRQSVLVAASSGRLTADWRERNRHTEVASELLSQIKVLRMEAALNAKEKKEIVRAFQPDMLTPTDDELLFNKIPDSWVACSIGAIGNVMNGSTPSRKRPEFWTGGIPWVSSGEVRNNIITATRECITQEGYRVVLCASCRVVLCCWR